MNVVRDFNQRPNAAAISRGTGVRVPANAQDARQAINYKRLIADIHL